MYLFVFFLCCSLQPIIHYNCVFGKRESLQRFIVEDGAKPAIFGSYSYDPVKQVFVPPPPEPDVKDTSKHQPPQSETQPSTQSDAQADTQSDTTTDTQTDPQSHLLITTPSGVSLGQSRIDSFISTAGDTGTDNPDVDKTLLRKHVQPLHNQPWWDGARKKTDKKTMIVPTS